MIIMAYIFYKSSVLFNIVLQRQRPAEVCKHEQGSAATWTVGTLSVCDGAGDAEAACVTAGAGSPALPVTPAGKEPTFFGLTLALLAVKFAFSVLIIIIIIICLCCSKLPMGEIVYWKKKKPLHLQSGPFVQHEAVLPGQGQLCLCFHSLMALPLLLDMFIFFQLEII